jgi:molecular chaperone HtpG
MNTPQHDKIVFEVEATRVLEILSREIYDSPLALLRENVQNAYDATLMRCTLEDIPLENLTIDLQVSPGQVVITDEGIGMTEEVLRNNFWKAGSSGKKNDLARRSGVVGTFGIGAMANFGVCKSLRVETRAVESDITLVSSAERAKLSFSKKCIDLEQLTDGRGPGTTLTAELEPTNPVTEEIAKSYLEPYVSYLPVKVLLNGQLISQNSYAHVIAKRENQSCGTMNVKQGSYCAKVEVVLDKAERALVLLTDVTLQGEAVKGDLVLAQGDYTIFGMRSSFGLAPVPSSGYYQLGGFVNLTILQPTAGREALSRESIGHVSVLVSMAEFAITELLAKNDAVDRNTSFQQYVLQKGKVDLAKRVTVFVQPEKKNIALGDILDYSKKRKLYTYSGHDEKILNTFSGPQSCLLQISQSNPRRRLQERYLSQYLRVESVPDQATLIKEYKPTELSLEEASFVARVTATLSEDYLLSDVEITLADISHGVEVMLRKDKRVLRIWLARNGAYVPPVVKMYRTAHEVFGGFVKDFIRNHLYYRLSDHIPSSTREGADALAQLLQKSRELYRYEESELGELEPLLGDWLSGEKSLAQVITTARGASRPWTHTVRRDQVGSLEEALPDVASAPNVADPEAESQVFEAAPAILREDVSCDLKILLAGSKKPQLNNFEMFLGLSDRLMKREGEFFRFPHTTRIIWAGHRIIYIFTDAAGTITLYYDMELRESLEKQEASGGMFPTTTLVTKGRIYVPVPKLLEPAFRITDGAKEFYVRFDTIVS